MLIAFWWQFSNTVQASPPKPGYQITPKNLQAHVNFLCSDLLEGRLTGSKGEKLATQYIANHFQKLGLEPAGDNGTYFQKFDFTAGVSLGVKNTLTISNPKNTSYPLVLDQDWRPLAFSDSILFTTHELVFAGYGVTAPALGDLPAYDSYQNLNVKNKWVIVLRYSPEKIPDAKSHQLSQYSALRYKAFIAKEHGAVGIIFVSGPNAKVKNELIPLSFDTSLSGSGIIALSITNNLANNLLNNNLQKLQDTLDTGQAVIVPVISHIQISGQTDIAKKIQHGRNVLAKLRTLGSAGMIIVGAHADHLGRGELSGSRARGREIGMIHPGADDNASGIASLLEVAAALSDLKARSRLPGNKDILLAAWSGEEFGILGSSHFVKKFINTATNHSLRPAIDAAINLDMVGHLQKNLILQGTGSSTDWVKLIDGIKPYQTISFITQTDPYLPTDSTAFYLQGVPIINFFTNAHDEYHSPRDKPDTLNYSGIQTISAVLMNLILALEKKPDLLNYQSIQQSSNYPKHEMKIYLGTIPDYASADGVGVKLSGVSKNSPAESAGIKSEDVVIELAGKNIHDIYDYTYVLNAMRVGKPVKMVVMRGQTKIALKIIARYRE